MRLTEIAILITLLTIYAYVVLLAASINITNNCDNDYHVTLWNEQSIICYLED